MLERMNRCWRVIGTGLSFFTFGTGGLLLRLLAFPLLRLLVWEQQLRTLLARNLIRLSMRTFVIFMEKIGILHYDLTGLNKLERNGLLIIANHPTLLDTVFLMAFVKQAGCIVKSSLWDNPFTHGPVRAAGYIKNESGPGLISACIAALEGGSNLIIFPEGTRSPRNGSIKFQRGAANVAVRGKRNLTPVMIRCTPTTLGKGDKWWNVPSRRFQLSLEVRDDIEIGPFVTDDDNETLAARRLNEYLQDYFAEENKYHAVT